ncbi:hypothetical protein ACHAWF_018127 [Thalassiosira exigua]
MASDDDDVAATYDDDWVARASLPDDDFNGTSSGYSSGYADYYDPSDYPAYDDDRYYSTKHTMSWLDEFLNNNTATKENSLRPVEDVNPDNVLATLAFNGVVCVFLLGTYELLRRWIPSVYSQRLVHERQRYEREGGREGGGGGGARGGRCGVEACAYIETKFARISRMKASGTSLARLRADGSLLNAGSGSGEQREGECGVEAVPIAPGEGGSAARGGDGDGGGGGIASIVDGAIVETVANDLVEDDEDSLAARSCASLRELEEPCEAFRDRVAEATCADDDGGRAVRTVDPEQISAWTARLCERTFSFPVLEWCVPVYKTPWSTYRNLAGLDTYFYLRYIRMCLKITAVSSFWSVLILCPVYATGGGDQSGFYYLSMANVLPDDKGRVWVPTIFCWAFTMYCWFCVREEMIHFVELRMEFLGGEEEEQILRRRKARSSTRGRASAGRSGEGGRGGGGGRGGPGAYESPGEPDGKDPGEDGRGRSRSPLLPDGEGGGGGAGGTRLGGVPSLARAGERMPPDPQVQKEMRQHRYSLQVEKVPVALRSNTALFNYFNEMFPNQVHSACIAMNVPDLEKLSARRQRVCRRLEKSLAYYTVTGIRPTHVAGRPRVKCCGIESTPIDGWCLLCCCFYDSCRMRTYLAKDDEDSAVVEAYDIMPDKGEIVDSISYYTHDLASCNLRMKRLQEEKFLIAETGNASHGRYAADASNCDWYTQPLGMLKTSAAMAAEGLREEFEVSGEEDYLGDGIPSGGGGGAGYGSTATYYERSDSSQSASRQRLSEKKTRLIDEDHLEDDERRADVNSTASSAVPPEDTEVRPSEKKKRKKKFYHRPYTWLRAILWRMGVDFLAAGLDEVRNRTDVVVDSVTRPSMSSTGFVTFKTLTPVTVTTSAPLTYNRNPMEVSIAPEPRDLVWKNVQIDRDIGTGRAFVADVLLGLGVLLWSIPLTLIQAWAKVEFVALIPGFEWVGKVHGDKLKPLINAYLPVITLLGLILILPLIFQLVATSYEKRKTLSGVQNSIVGRYFYYQLANIYITVTAGALWTSLADIIDHPQQLLVILGESLPKLAGYFISLLLTKTLAGLPMVLLRAGALSRMMFMRSCFNKRRLTDRELREVYRKQPLFFGWEYPTQFLVIIICFTYACITPIVLPVGAVYYFCALLVYKKQSLYVYTPTYESGGMMFPQAVSKTLFALLISQLTFIGYTLIRKGVFQIILLAPLPFLTIFFTIFIQHRYVTPSRMLSLERAVKIDALLDQPEFSDEAYQQPCLTEKASAPAFETDDEILTEVMENLNRLQNVLSEPSQTESGSSQRVPEPTGIV